MVLNCINIYCHYLILIIDGFFSDLLIGRPQNIVDTSGPAYGTCNIPEQIRRELLKIMQIKSYISNVNFFNPVTFSAKVKTYAFVPKLTRFLVHVAQKTWSQPLKMTTSDESARTSEQIKQSSL